MKKVPLWRLPIVVVELVGMRVNKNAKCVFKENLKINVQQF
jgi:hypothetical protein